MKLNHDHVIQVDDLVKSYGSVRAVDHISFFVSRGNLFAFLGVNGAGKSTTINIISTILKKDSGKVYINGHDLDIEANKIKNEIGIVFQNSVLDTQLTVKQNLEIRTSFYALTKAQRKANINKIINLLDLKDILNRRISQLSGGQKRRVDIARAMVHTPKILILDEPTTGLDPKTRQMVWQLIDKIRQETGMTVFLTTHYLEEAEQASYVIVIDRGHIIAHGLPVDLKNQYSSDYLIVYGKKNKAFEKSLSTNKEKYHYDSDRKGYVVSCRRDISLKSVIKQYDKFIKDFEVLKGTMDDAFINITGRKHGGEE